jgi:hypothetical protein
MAVTEASLVDGPGYRSVASALGRLVSGYGLRITKAEDSAERRRRRRVMFVWWLLFFDVLGAAPTHLLPIPHKIGQAMTQGALILALLLALSVNPRVRLRPNIYLGLFTVLGVTTLMSSVRLVSVGTAYRGFRLLEFIAVLWLLTPWWGRRDLILLRSHLRFLGLILVSVVIGLLLTPGSALAGGRLGGALWPIPPTQVAHYSAVVAGLAVVLWASKLLRAWPAILMGVPSLVILVLTHTRTALVAAAGGCLIATLSLFTSSRRVRRAFTAGIVGVALVGVPLAPFVVHWLARGESAGQLASLTGRTNFWGYVFQAASQRPLTNEILGDGLSNGAVNDPYAPGVSGLPIDSSWVEDYQDQGLAGDVLVGLMFVALLLMAAFRPRGPTRAIALFLTVYCLLASFTEDGAGIASQYALDMTVAASLLAPTLAEVRARAPWARPLKPRPLALPG